MALGLAPGTVFDGANSRLLIRWQCVCSREGDQDYRDRGGRGWEECVRSKKESSQGNRIEDESGFGEVHCDRLVGT